MRYELFLRRAAASTDDADDADDGRDVLSDLVDAARARAGELLRVEPFAPDERRGADGGAGDGGADGGADGASALSGVDLGVEPDADGAAERLCEAAFALAEARGLTVFDPQLGRAVTRADEDVIAEQLRRTHAFAAAAVTSLDAPPSVGSRAAAKGWLIIAAVIVALFVLVRVLRCAAV